MLLNAADVLITRNKINRGYAPIGSTTTDHKVLWGRDQLGGAFESPTQAHPPIFGPESVPLYKTSPMADIYHAPTAAIFRVDKQHNQAALAAYTRATGQFYE